MKRLAVNIAMTLVLFLIVGFSFDAIIGTMRRKEHRFGELVRAQKGRTREAAIQTLGKPSRIMGFGQYKERLPGIAGSFEPDPQLIECDQVYEYGVVATMGLLYVQNGIVVETYVGGT
jgi:hypothetical protein